MIKKVLVGLMMFLGLFASIEIGSDPADKRGVNLSRFADTPLPSLGVSSLNSPAAAASRIQWPGPFRVDVLKVHDGDTVLVSVQDHCPFGCTEERGLSLINIRLRGIDTPEVHLCRQAVTPSCAACPEEASLGALARERVANLVRDHPTRIRAIGADKYRGRVVADLEVFRGGEWLSVGQTLLSQHLALPYEGGTKTKPWCPHEEKHHE